MLPPAISSAILESFKTPRPRLATLDYLRGFCAVGIMLYHYASWSMGELSAKSLGGRVGIYGVSIFYVLSGLTLTYNYRNKLEFNLKSVFSFLQKRFFRIFPLLWLATLLSVALSKQVPSVTDIVLNVTGLFGFFKWDTYFATGAWSIGNELTFYSLFPILLLALRRSTGLFLFLCAIISWFYINFAFGILNPEVPLAQQWHFYTNPANQALFFLGGMLLHILFNNMVFSQKSAILLGVLGMGLFVFFPSSTHTIDLVTGISRTIFTLGSFLICLSFYKNSFLFPDFLDVIFGFLGKSSYSIYLLHPIVYSLVNASATLASKHSLTISVGVVVSVSIACTITASSLVYNYFETYFIRLGNKF